MQPNRQRTTALEVMAWTGRIISLPLGVLLLFDGALRWFRPAFVEYAISQLGHLGQNFTPLAIALLRLAVEAVPEPAVHGAIRVSAQLNDTLAAHIQAGNGFVCLILGLILVGTFLLGLIEGYEL